MDWQYHEFDLLATSPLTRLLCMSGYFTVRILLMTTAAYRFEQRGSYCLSARAKAKLLMRN
jgi:hypothetical protein